MARQNISAGFVASGVEDWESVFGFSRAVREDIGHYPQWG
jgi:hypothetical protein